MHVVVAAEIVMSIQSNPLIQQSKRQATCGCVLWLFGCCIFYLHHTLGTISTSYLVCMRIYIKEFKRAKT